MTAIVQAWIGSIQGSGSSSIAKAFGSAVTAGNFLVVTSSQGSTNNNHTIADTNGNTWFTAVTRSVSFGGIIDQRSTIFYAPNAKAGATTVTVSGTNVSDIGIAEYSGLLTASPLDGTNSSLTADPGNIVTTVAGLVIGYVQSVNDVTAGTGFTKRLDQSLGGRFKKVEDQITSAAGTYDAAWSASAAQTMSLAAAFKVSPDVTAALTGVAMTSGVGLLALNMALLLSGVAGTGSSGVLVPTAVSSPSGVDRGEIYVHSAARGLYVRQENTDIHVTKEVP